MINWLLYQLASECSPNCNKYFAWKGHNVSCYLCMLIPIGFYAFTWGLITILLSLLITTK